MNDDGPDLPDVGGSTDPFRVWLITGLREALNTTRMLERRVQRIENLLWAIGVVLAMVVPILLAKIAGIDIKWGG